MGNLFTLINQPDDHVATDETQSEQTAPTSQDIRSMCTRVKEVLPQVPLDVIARDLRITSDVDESITRLLDGTVKYIPESTAPSTSLSTQPADQPSSSKASDPPSSVDVPSLSTAASNFGKNSSERMQSLEERKKMLIEAARVRYLAKHRS